VFSKLFNFKFQISNFKSSSNDKFLNKENFFWLLFFILTFPTSFFFGAVYTEGLFFLLFALTLYFLKKENYWLVSLFGQGYFVG